MGLGVAADDLGLVKSAVVSEAGGSLTVGLGVAVDDLGLVKSPVVSEVGGSLFMGSGVAAGVGARSFR